MASKLNADNMTDELVFYGDSHVLGISQSNCTWKCTLLRSVEWRTDTPPNVVHRFMQRVAFGFKWEKLS